MPSKQIQTILGYGHQHNPSISHLFTSFTPESFDALTPESVEGMALVRSFQLMMEPEHTELVASAHSRAPHFDGEIGPATELLIALWRCGCPDYLPLDLEMEAETGTGSWGVGCTTEFPSNHAIYYHLDDSRMPSIVRGWWDEIIEWVSNAYAETGIRFLRTIQKSMAHSHVSFQPLSGSTIGLAQLPGASAAASCSRGFFCKLDPSYRPNAVQVAKLLAHEWAHNMRIGHIQNDPVQHPGIRPGWNFTFKATELGVRLDRSFGGEFLPPIGEPDPPPPEPPIDPQDSLKKLRTDFLIQNAKNQVRFNWIESQLADLRQS